MKESQAMMKKGVKKMAFGGMSGGVGGKSLAARPSTPPPRGGVNKPMPTGRSSAPVKMSPAPAPAPRGGVNKPMPTGRSGAPVKMSPAPVPPRGGVSRTLGMRSGGSASSRADGVAHKGKTKGKMIKMNKGGYC